MTGNILGQILKNMFHTYPACTPTGFHLVIILPCYLLCRLLIRQVGFNQTAAILIQLFLKDTGSVQPRNFGSIYFQPEVYKLIHICLQSPPACTDSATVLIVATFEFRTKDLLSIDTHQYRIILSRNSPSESKEDKHQKQSDHKHHPFFFIRLQI